MSKNINEPDNTYEVYFPKHRFTKLCVLKVYLELEKNGYTTTSEIKDYVDMYGIVVLYNVRKPKDLWIQDLLDFCDLQINNYR